MKCFLLVISILILNSCNTYEVSSNVNINDVKYQYEELYLDEVDLDIDREKNIQINQENWKRIKANLVKIHYHILKIQSQLDRE